MKALKTQIFNKVCHLPSQIVGQFSFFAAVFKLACLVKSWELLSRTLSRADGGTLIKIHSTSLCVYAFFFNPDLIYSRQGWLIACKPALAMWLTTLQNAALTCEALTINFVTGFILSDSQFIVLSGILMCVLSTRTHAWTCIHTRAHTPAYKHAIPAKASSFC